MCIIIFAQLLDAHVKMSFILTASTWNVLNKVNEMQIMNARLTVNWTDRQSHQMQHIRTQPSLRGKYFSWHSLTLFWILIVEQVSTPLHNRCTVRGGGRNKGNVPIVPEASGSLMCSGNEMAGKKKKRIHYSNWPLPTTAAKTSAPDVTSQSPRSESFGGICFMPDFHGNQTFPSQAQTATASGFSGEAVIVVRKRTADKCCERRLLESRNSFPHWSHQEGQWNPRTESCSGERDDRSALISVTDTIQQNDTHSPEIR